MQSSVGAPEPNARVVNSWGHTTRGAKEREAKETLQIWLSLFQDLDIQGYVVGAAKKRA